ncbi:ubiquitin carboxyl-terminal hydrolase-domain-containing protein, partial [Pseudomassariella vexata]
AFFSLFKPAKKPEEDQETEQEKEEKEAAKVKEVSRRLAELDIANVTDDHVLYALHSKFAAGDVNKAVELMELQKTSFSGKISHYNPNIRMLGAENRGNVTCYLDALLFAMFAKLEAFECMLKTELPEEPQRRLAALLRLWVNMLRSGKLIQTDMTQHIQDALAACGWRDAQLLEQQDTSEAFAFITETLQLPLLTLQVDLFHQGKNDEADHKVVYERLLNLAVPPDTDGKVIRLEDCLEEYFNSQVDVHRDSLEEKRRMTLTPTPRSPDAPATPSSPRSTIRIVSDDDEDDNKEAGPVATAEHAEMAPLERRWTERPGSQPAGSQETQLSGRPNRSRTESIIQRVVLDNGARPFDSDSASLFERAKRSVSVVKAVTIPAWQFFRLIPWHSPANEEPRSDLEVARHFSQRPVVGICLKRYMMNDKGVPMRQNTYIDIPDSLRLPHFIVDERHVEEHGLSTEYKLILQSVVCHRGDSLHSGHYISFCRVAPKLLTDNRRHDNDPPPDYEEAQWVKFDDLCYEDRVITVDDIKQSLKDEMPYLLFYQVVPIVDVTASSTDGTELEPPSYTNTTLNVTVSDISDHAQDRPVMSRQASSYFENWSTLPSTNASVRFSSELELPSRRSFGDDEGFLSASRRGSLMYDTSTGVSPVEGHSPAVTPSDETTAQRLSRAAAKFSRGSKSRTDSQAGEGRISITMSRLSGLVRASREPLRDSTSTDPDEEGQETANPNGTNGKDKDKDSSPHRHKRGRSKARPDKGKGKENKK